RLASSQCELSLYVVDAADRAQPAAVLEKHDDRAGARRNRTARHAARDPSVMLDADVSLAAHASRGSRCSLLSMRLLCFNTLDLILRRPRSVRLEGWAAIPVYGSCY